MARGVAAPVDWSNHGKLVRGQYARTDPGRDFARRAGTNGSRAGTQGLAYHITPATIAQPIALRT